MHQETTESEMEKEEDGSVKGKKNDQTQGSAHSLSLSMRASGLKVASASQETGHRDTARAFVSWSSFYSSSSLSLVLVSFFLLLMSSLC